MGVRVVLRDTQDPAVLTSLSRKELVLSCPQHGLITQSFSLKTEQSQVSRDAEG